MRASEITLEQVELAYEKHGLTPSSGAVQDYNGECCALGALAFDVLGRAATHLQEAAEALALGPESRDASDFAYGFDDGFDGYCRTLGAISPRHERPAYRRGFEIGVALRSKKAPQVSS